MFKTYETELAGRKLVIETGKKTSFWNFIKNNTIKIPIIQRDYAQGRADEENIREQFVHYLKEALDKNSSEPTILDFVYGSKYLDSILPLDGQQRLTTVTLLLKALSDIDREKNDSCYREQSKSILTLFVKQGNIGNVIKK